MNARTIFNLFIAAAALFCGLFTTAVPQSRAAAGAPDKVPVYEAMAAYCSAWSENESAVLEKFSGDEASDDARAGAFKLLGEKLAGNGEARSALSKIAEGLPALFAPLAENEKEFFRKGKFESRLLRQNTKIFAASARYLAASNEGPLALKLLLAALIFVINNDEALADNSSSPSGIFVDRLVSVACQNVCLQSAVRALVSAEFNEKTLVSFYKSVEYIERRKPPFQQAIETGKKEALKIIEDIASLDPARFDASAAAALFPPGAYRAAAAEIRKSPFALKLAGLYAAEGARQITESFDAMAKAFALPYHQALPRLQELDGKLMRKHYNNLFAQLVIPNFIRMHEQLHKNSAAFDFVKISACLKLYKLKNGKYPAALDEASKALSLPIPADRFSGKAYEYAKMPSGGFVVISAGPDMAVTVKPKDASEAVSGGFTGASDDLVLTDTGCKIK